MGKHRAIVGAGFVIVSLVACGTGTPLDGALTGGTVTPTGSSGTLDDATCAKNLAYAEAECAYLVRCGGYGQTSGEACSRARAGGLNERAVTKKIPANVDDCIAEMNAPGCGPTPTCATLVRTTPAALGESCKDVSCGVGLTCTNRVCAARSAEGGPCNYSSDGCLEGLGCPGTKCVKIDATSDCRDDDDCATARDANTGYELGARDNRLRTDFLCSDATHKCFAVARGIGQGQACGKGKVCAEGFFCKYATRDDGTCEVPTKIGDHCVEGDGCPMCVGGECSDPAKAFCSL